VLWLDEGDGAAGMVGMGRILGGPLMGCLFLSWGALMVGDWLFDASVRDGGVTVREVGASVRELLLLWQSQRVDF